jgi:HAMP domain-containing protein
MVSTRRMGEMPIPSRLDETALRRAVREFPGPFLGLRGFAWSAICGAVAVGASIYLSAQHSTGAQVAIGVALFLGGVGFAALSVFAALWVTAPIRQRDEARDELAKARASAKFPNARIDVKALGHMRTRDGARALIFTVQVTNREPAQRMNLELDFYLRAFKSIARLNPGLKPLDARLSLLDVGESPPRPLIIDSQHTTPELSYVADGEDPILDHSLTFDEDMGTFRPTKDDDELVLKVLDLQTGGRIETPIPSVWES